jgi:hypothetical protein
MTAIRIETTIDSDTLHLPQLKPLMGKTVEIIVREMPQRTLRPDDRAWVSPLAGTVIEYSEPFEPAVPSDEWEANR